MAHCTIMYNDGQVTAIDSSEFAVPDVVKFLGSRCTAHEKNVLDIMPLKSYRGSRLQTAHGGIR